MAQYTIADIEILRQKSGISYEEAVNLLEYHNGSLARSLVDLEKNGRIRDVPNQKTYGAHSRRHRSLFDALFRFRVVMRKGDVTVLNLSVLFLIFALFTAPWLVVIGTLVALVDAAEWATRPLATLDAEQADINAHDLGRELFGGMRRTVRSAEEGAITWL